MNKEEIKKKLVDEAQKIDSIYNEAPSEYWRGKLAGIQCALEIIARHYNEEEDKVLEEAKKSMVSETDTSNDCSVVNVGNYNILIPKVLPFCAYNANIGDIVEFTDTGEKFKIYPEVTEGSCSSCWFKTNVGDNKFEQRITGCQGKIFKKGLY